MGWESDGMLRVYYDPRIAITDESGWFFRSYAPAHMTSSPLQGRAGPPGPCPLALRIV
jgi:hypothetical protein